MPNRYHLQDTAARLLPKSRTAACQRCRVQTAGAISVLETTTPRGNTVHRYGNVMSCGTPWICPTCAAKIAGVRRRELSQALERAFARNWQVSLLTLTIQHDRQSDLAKLLGDLQRVFKKFTDDRAWRTHKVAAGLVGYTRVLEIVDSPAGWHPHYHLLLFHQGDTMSGEAYSTLWRQACTSANVACPASGAVDLRPMENSRIAWYLCKDTRLTWGHVDADDDDDSEERTIWELLGDAWLGDSMAAARFCEYARATKGKKKLIWSPKLRAALGLRTAKSDMQAAQLPEEETMVPVIDPPRALGFLDLVQWQHLCDYGLRGEFLHDVRQRGWEVAFANLGKHLQAYPTKKPPGRIATGR